LRERSCQGVDVANQTYRTPMSFIFFALALLPASIALCAC
jgi:hypothetical protein